ncbi:MAG: IS21 family transposase, partial [Sulfitobacter sp.]|nr:IS21 family transposase [Sulfitobacter sp.]
MIPYETRQAILTLKAQGQPLREISRILKVSRNTVRRALREPKPKAPSAPSGQEEVIALLPEIYQRCKGNAVRIQEILKDEHAIEAPYSTLTRLIREQELRDVRRRSGIYTFGPGAEMQHDTSPHRLTLGEKTLTAQCASLILAYCRELFFQYYPAFTRFEAKAFLTEALRFFDGSCRRCTIDNTSVIIAGGSGPDALIAPEMEAFGELFGLVFIPHAIGHSDRKGRIERPFSYIEGNFLAGRTFRDWADLNAQARAWCQQTANAKPKRILGISPQAASVMEKPHLTPLPSYIPPVTQIHYRVVDTQGYVHLDTNRYSVPERFLGKKVAVHKRPEQVLVFQGQNLVAEHPRLIGLRNTDHLIKAHHLTLQRGKTPSGPSPQEQALQGRDPLLDR